MHLARSSELMFSTFKNSDSIIFCKMVCTSNLRRYSQKVDKYEQNGISSFPPLMKFMTFLDKVNSLFYFIFLSSLQKNWNLFSVNVAMAGTGILHLSRKIK